jgi:hypothetical protein
MSRTLRAFVLVAAAAAAAALLAIPLPAHAATSPRTLFARERAASGGDAWSAIRAISSAGTVTQGGSPNPFVELVNHDTGWSKATTRVGSLVDVSGYDGTGWDFQGGPVTMQTLPGLVADNVTAAYVARDGWWNPADPATMSVLGDGAVRVVPRGGSAIDVWFDGRTGLMARMVAHADTGPVSTVVDDYRTVGSVVIAFRTDSHDATGAETLQQAREVQVLTRVATSAFERPQPRSSGTVTGAVPAVVRFTMTGQPGAIAVTVRAGTHTLPVIFDSGVANFLVTQGARKLGLRGAGGLSIGGVGNASLSASIAALPSLALGRAVLHDQHAILAPLPYAFVHQSRNVDTYGLVGAEYLQAFRTSFDFVGLRMRLAPFSSPAASSRASVLPVLSDGQHAYVRAAIDGVSGLFLLDTGDSGDITVFRRFANAHHLFAGPSLPYLAVGGVGGHLAYHRYRARSFTLGGATMHAPPVTVSDATAGSFASRSVAGNIGLRVISRYDITFDLRGARVVLSPNSIFSAPYVVDRSGLSLDQPEPATFAVLSVVPDSPAAQAGLTTGATIVAVNGISIAAARLGLDDVEKLVTGTQPYTLTVRAAGSDRVLTIAPRDIMPPPS